MYTVYIRYFWQGNHQVYTVIYGAYIRFWSTLHMELFVTEMKKLHEATIYLNPITTLFRPHF
jgi:hypothetical protein